MNPQKVNPVAEPVKTGPVNTQKTVVPVYAEEVHAGAQKV